MIEGAAENGRNRLNMAFPLLPPHAVAAEADEVGNLSLEAGFVWLETNATVPETDAICERLAAMKIGYGVRQMHIDKAFHGIYTTGGGLGTKMGIYVKESDYEQARPIAESTCA